MSSKLISTNLSIATTFIDVQSLVQEVNTAAIAAGIGGNVRAMLSDVARQFFEVETNKLNASQTIASPVRASRKYGLSPAFWKKAGFLLKVLPKQRRQEIVASLVNDRRQLVAQFGDWLRRGPPNLVAWFEQCSALAPSDSDKTQEIVHRGLDTLMESAAAGRIKAIFAYLANTLAPKASEIHARVDKAGIRQVDERDLFRDLKQDSNYKDFIDEMPRLLTDASLATFRALAPILESGQNISPMHEIDSHELQTFVHSLYLLMRVAGEYLVPVECVVPTDIQMCAFNRVMFSASTTLFLNFLYRRYPYLLTPNEHDAVDDAIDVGFEQVKKTLHDVCERMEFVGKFPDFPAELRLLRTLASDLLQKLDNLLTWLQNLMSSAGSGIDLPYARDDYRLKHPNDTEEWLQTTELHCMATTPGEVAIHRTCTKSCPDLSHCIGTSHTLFEGAADAALDATFACWAWSHVPNGDVSPSSDLFISPAEVLGRKHLISSTADSIMLVGNAMQRGAYEAQRRASWLDYARAHRLTTHAVFYYNEMTDFWVVFNLFSAADVAKLGLADAVVPMANGFRAIYEVMLQTKCDLPNDAKGKPLTVDNLCLEILDISKEDDEDEEQMPLPTPSFGGKRLPAGHRSRLATEMR